MSEFTECSWEHASGASYIYRSRPFACALTNFVVSVIYFPSALRK